MSIRFFGAYARINGDVVEHENEIIGAHLWEVHWGYMVDNEFDIDGAFSIQANRAQDAWDIAKILLEERGDSEAILHKEIRLAMW